MQLGTKHEFGPIKAAENRVLPDKDTCVWKDQLTTLLSPIPPGWAAAASAVLLGTHISLEHKPTTHVFYTAAASRACLTRALFHLCASEGTVTMQ